MRRFSRLCLSKFAEKKLVIGTGQPGIGKTRGALYFSLKTLLWHGFVVLRVSYNSGLVHLFLPDRHGVYHVWEGSAFEWMMSTVASKPKGVFALIDPPEHPNYVRSARCNVLEFASNHQERHLKNADKDGLIRIMKMPSVSEILCLEPLLWTSESEPSIDTPLSVEDRRRVLVHRYFLVGCVTRVVFNNEAFHKQLAAVAFGATKISAKMGIGSLFALYAQGIARPETSGCVFPSRFFLMEASDDERSISIGRLNSVSIYHLRNELNESIAEYRGALAFAFEDVCSKLLRGGMWNGRVFPPRNIAVGANLQDTTTLIKHSTDLIAQGEPGVVVRASSCYPILDFAVSDTFWFNAKVGQSQVKISLSAFVTLMLDLGFAQINGADFSLRGPPPRISLTMIRNSNVSTFTFERAMAQRYQGLDVDQIQRIFEQTVTVSFLNTAAWAPNDVLSSRADVTAEILQLYPPL